MTLATIRHICMFSLPLLLATSLTLDFCFPHLAWVSAFYTICLTANIGYFTNYIAINMLFRPYYKTALCRQGLIPKNQDKLADSLSQTLIDNFLSKQQWRDYLIKSNLVNKVLSEAMHCSLQWLSRRSNAQLINNFLIDYIKQNEEAVNHHLDKIQQQLVNGFSADLEPHQLLSKGFEWLELQFENNPQQMQLMIEPIIKTIAENIPEIANGLSTTLDAHIEEQDSFKRGIAKMAKWSADFNIEDIKSYLFRLVASFEFRETLLNGFQRLISEYKNKPIVESHHFEIASIENDQLSLNGLSFNQIIQKLISTQLANIKWNESIKTQLLSGVDLQPTLQSIHSLVFKKIENELNDGPLHSWMIEELVSMIEKLDLRLMVKQKAKTFTPEKMENIFHTMISEQLVFIELLGALLGALAGLALVDIRLFGGLAALLSSYYLLDFWLTKGPASSA
jgi:uncharacterized membrane protein YheB (UPF0754 family)